jgi:signal transduction histidine kinase
MLNLDIKPVNLSELARTRCQRLTPLAARGEVTLDLIDTQRDCIALGDADRLAQIFDNLLDNAIRHARSGSRVLITIKPVEDQIQSEVRDQGVGIPREHLPYIFERFYRVSKSRDRQSGGSGLGLAIVCALVQAQGGRITADSVEGQGTVITFWLPAVQTDTKLPQN